LGDPPYRHRAARRPPPADLRRGDHPQATIEKTRPGRRVPGRHGARRKPGFAQLNLSALTGALAAPTSPRLVLAAASNERVRLPNGELVPAHTVLLTALQTDTDLNVLSAPNVITTDNEEAEIVVGRNVPFVASRATSASNLSNLFTTIERRDVGITLRITPQITADDFVRLTLFEGSRHRSDCYHGRRRPAMVGPTTTIRRRAPRSRRAGRRS
jgi:type II secretory pathway component GspD/PulD (secretin)